MTRVEYTKVEPGSVKAVHALGPQFNVRTGALLRDPAKDPFKTYRVTAEGEVGRINVPLALVVQSE
jgi:hypothetical protein